LVTRDGLDPASETLWDRCCFASLKNTGVAATYTEDGQLWVASDPAHEQLVLGYAPVDPGAANDLCGGGSIDAAGSESLIGVAQGGRSAGTSSPFGGLPGDGGSNIAGVGGGNPGFASPGARQSIGWAPGVVAPSSKGAAPARVPEIDAVSGIVALAMLAALVAFKRERR
jgi:hypothetical protein